MGNIDNLSQKNRKTRIVKQLTSLMKWSRPCSNSIRIRQARNNTIFSVLIQNNERATIHQASGLQLLQR